LAPAASMAAFRDAEALSVPHAMPSARQVAAYVREHSSPAARVIFWGYGSALYYLSQRRPATRFLYVTYLVDAVEGTPSWWSPFHPSRALEIPRAWDLFFEDLERHPPSIFVDTAEPGYFAFWKFPPARYPRLQAYLDAHYVRENVAGFPVWLAKPGFAEPLAASTRCSTRGPAQHFDSLSVRDAVPDVPAHLRALAL